MTNTKPCGFGSHPGYMRHLYHGEPPCKGCKVAHAMYERQARRKRGSVKRRN